MMANTIILEIGLHFVLQMARFRYLILTSRRISKKYLQLTRIRRNIKFHRHSGPIWQVAWSHPRYGSMLASCSFDKNITVWKENSLGKWEKASNFSKQRGSVNSISWAPFDIKIAAGCSDGTVTVFTLLEQDQWDQGIVI